MSTTNFETRYGNDLEVVCGKDETHLRFMVDLAQPGGLDPTLVSGVDDLPEIVEMGADMDERKVAVLAKAAHLSIRISPAA